MSMRIGWAAVCFAAIMGFSRLAYGLLVPAMRESLGGALAVYGLIGAANLAGYFVGSVFATRLSAQPERARVNMVALLAMCAAIGASGAAHDLWLMGVLRFIVGLASGVALSLTLALAVEGVDAAKRGRVASIIWAGGAAGIALVGAATLIFPLDGIAWRLAWVAMGMFGVFATLMYARITRGERHAMRARDDGKPVGLWSKSKYLPLAVGYFAYAIGYIDVITFFGAALARSHAAPLSIAVVLLGISGSIGALLWGPLVDRFANGVPVAMASGLCAVGAWLLSTNGALVVLAGAVIFGLSFIGVPAMIGALAQQREPPGRYARAFALLTATLGVGQILGPYLGGVVADRFGTVAALDVGAVALATGGVCYLFYRRPHERASNSLAARETYAVT